MKLYELFNMYLENKVLAESTYNSLKRNVEKVFKPLLKNVELDEITTNDITGFVNFKKATNVKSITIYGYYRQLSAFFNYAIESNLLVKLIIKSPKTHITDMLLCFKH